MNALETTFANGESTGSPRTVPKVLAVGAAGATAGMVIPELARRGVHVRGLIQDSKQTVAVRNQGAAEVAVGDLSDRRSMDAALEGMDAMFFIAPAFIPHEAEIGVSVVAAAVRAGVRRVVFSSVIDPIISALVNHSAKAPVEEAIIESGMEYALLQPALFMQGIARSWPTVLETGVFAEPWSSDTRFTRVDYRDVAEVAAIALTEDRLLYGTYQLCAEGNLNRHEVAALMSDVLGRHIEAVRVGTPNGASAGDRAADVSPINKMFAWYDKRGLLGNALILRAILGREPRTLKTYLEELTASASPPTTGAPR